VCGSEQIDGRWKQYTPKHDHSLRAASNRGSPSRDRATSRLDYVADRGHCDMTHRFFVVLIVCCVISFFLTFVAPIYNIARRPVYFARIAYVNNGRTWLVDQRFGSRTFVLAGETARKLGVIAIPVSGDPYRSPISESDWNLVVVQQEIGWPFASMLWRARYSDLPNDFDSADPMPKEIAMGSRGFGDAFEIKTPGGRATFYLHAAYWPGWFSYSIITANVVTVASTISICWMTTVLALRTLRNKAIGRRCANCGYPAARDPRLDVCPECGSKHH